MTDGQKHSQKTVNNAAPGGAPEAAALAMDVCNLWQEHLAKLASSPEARAELARLLEPQRQAMAKLFADYSAMMQHPPHGETSPHTPQREAAAQRAAAHESAAPAPGGKPAGAEAGAAPFAASSDDGALRVAQLAHRISFLEERLARLESRLAARGKRAARKAAEKPGDGDA